MMIKKIGFITLLFSWSSQSQNETSPNTDYLAMLLLQASMEQDKQQREALDALLAIIKNNEVEWQKYRRARQR